MIKLPRVSNLYGQIFAIFWLTLLIVLIAITVAPHFDPRNQQLINQKQIEKFSLITNNIHDRLDPDQPLLKNIQRIQKEAQKRSNGELSIYVSNSEGELYSCCKPKTEHSHHSKKYQGKIRAVRNFITLSDNPNSPQQKGYGRFLISGPFKTEVSNEPVWFYFSHSSKPSMPFIYQVLDRPISLLLLTMLVSTPLLLWLAWALSTPARRLQVAAERVAKGEISTDPDLEKGATEFKQAGISFNLMVSSINQLMSGQQRLLSDISHELRSPLTRLRMATALAVRKQGESKELTRIELEAERLEKMIASLLSLSRMQVDNHQNREQITINELWQEMLDNALFEAEQLDKTLTYHQLDQTLISGNLNLLVSALENVIRNAIKYSDYKINIDFTTEHHQLKITIDDDGLGVPEQELKEIFRPFYRVSTARDRETGGTGLGLAITENAIIQHQGTILASKSPLGGLRIEITLPTIK
ncbi:envelope stress sensor histidine kinase CpxA [Vibrio sp. SS-MA-C1-2]|uniref:envelope stress sensor histidine kinase CpxA n=1 Tax=Vibrio sp. SS-MA-C1-2 TaxID=2908646 RepID=UPI001F1FF3C1|nr:envelope stress sensor histidine kinase CpxA [Vibrio sp. SS-MA-C1-2]UJF19414.1 envelope stress sensor histidine kinase CpxA [Vibrio sp. SS-MA-C1-2]